MSIGIASIGALGLVLLYAGLTAKTRRHQSRQNFVDAIARDAGLRAKGSTVAFGLGGLWLATLLLSAGLTSSLIVAGSIATAVVWLPLALLRTRADKRQRRFGEAWPDAIATLIAAVRAGVALPEACIDLTKRGPVELAPGFEAFAATYRATGSFAAALHRLREVLADPVADRVAVSLGLAHEVGGSDLVRVLRAVGDFVREDLRVRREIEARWSWTVTAARVAAAAPWLVLLMMSTRPEAADAFDSVTGATVIGAGAVATLVGYRLMLRAARLPQDPRLPR